MSLITPMIAVAITGLALVAVLEISTQLNRQMKTSEASVEIIGALADLSTVMANPETCVAALGKGKIVPPRPGQKLEVLLPSGQTLAEGSQVGGNRRITVNSLWLSDVTTISDVPGERTISANLNLSFNKASDPGSVNGSLQSKPYTAAQLILKTDSNGRLRSCVGVNGSASLCKELGGRYDEKATPQCDLSALFAAIGDCGPNHYMQGFDPSGRKICRQIASVSPQPFQPLNAVVESNGYAYASRDFPFEIGDVELVNQHSYCNKGGGVCQEGVTYRKVGNRLEVIGGCRAEFRVYPKGQTAPAGAFRGPSPAGCNQVYRWTD